MRVGIIGAGRMATGFALLLTEAEIASQIQLTGIYNRTEKKAIELAERVNSKVASLAELKADSDLIFILTNDSSIEEVAALLAQLPPADKDIGEKNTRHVKKTVIHCSGLLTSKILEPLALQGWQTASLHPLQSVTGGEAAHQALKKCWYTVEGDLAGVDVVTGLMKNFGAEIVTIQPEQKILYHAAACVTSNYLTTLVKMAIDLFEAAGFDEASGKKALWPLLLGTLANIENMGPEDALTGPIARGDWSTIADHIKELTNKQSPYLDLYKALGKHTSELAIAQGNITLEQQQYFVHKILGGKQHEDSSPSGGDAGIH